LLVDERATLGDLSRSSLTFRIEDIGATNTGTGNSNSNININGSMTTTNLLKEKTNQGTSSEVRRWNKKTDMKLTIKNGGYNFEMFKIFIISLLVILPIASYHMYEYFTNSLAAERFRNCLDLYTHSVNMMGIYITMRGSLLSTILWGDSVSFQGNRSSSTYSMASQVFSQTITPEFVKMREWDFGPQYTPFYKKVSGELDVCNFVKSYGTKRANCTMPIIGYEDSNFIYYLRGASTMMDDMFNTWNSEIGVTALEIISTPKYKKFFGVNYNGWGIVEEIYYALLVPLATTIKALLNPSLQVSSQDGVYSLDASQNSPSEYYLTFVVPLTLISGIAFTILVYVKLLRVVFDFWHTGFLIPMNLIKKNPLLDKFFKTLEKRAKTTITFF
jgi:hypothetical protein